LLAIEVIVESTNIWQMQFNWCYKLYWCTTLYGNFCFDLSIKNLK